MNKPLTTAQVAEFKKVLEARKLSPQSQAVLESVQASLYLASQLNGQDVASVLLDLAEGFDGPTAETLRAASDQIMVMTGLALDRFEKILQASEMASDVLRTKIGMLMTIVDTMGKAKADD